MTQMTISPFVNIINKSTADELGLVHEKIDYPVFAIDVLESDSGSETVFLVANQKGEFVWVDSSDVKRANKKNTSQKYRPTC